MGTFTVGSLCRLRLATRPDKDGKTCRIVERCTEGKVRVVFMEEENSGKAHVHSHGVHTKHLEPLIPGPRDPSMDEVQTPPPPPDVGSRWTLGNMPELNGKLCQVQSWHGQKGKVSVVGDPKGKEHGVHMKCLEPVIPEPRGSTCCMDEEQTPPPPDVGSRWTLRNMPEFNGKLCQVQSWHGQKGKVFLFGDPTGKEHPVSRKRLFPIRSVDAQLAFEQWGSVSPSIQCQWGSLVIGRRSCSASADNSPERYRDPSDCTLDSEAPVPQSAPCPPVPRNAFCPRRRRSTGDTDTDILNALKELALRGNVTARLLPGVPPPSLAPSRDEFGRLWNGSGSVHSASASAIAADGADTDSNEVPPDYNGPTAGNRQKRAAAQHRKTYRTLLGKRTFEIVPW